MTSYRIERDSLGEFQVPAQAWYGVQTARAMENFSISRRRPDDDFIRALAQVKYAAALANCQTGWLDPMRCEAITAACKRLLAGEFTDQFVVDRFQAGAGTCYNMNANEVIANIANVNLGSERGTYTPVHPNDHVNLGQSTNDVIPTALRLTVLAKLPRLTGAVERMAAAFEDIARREHDTVKSGRTHLQDAVPTTIGREFGAYAWILRRAADNLSDCRARLCQTGLGGTAVGTGLTTAPGYGERAAAELARLTGEPISIAHLAGQMQSMLDLQQFSGQLRGLALELIRIANDLRLLASGPRTGLDEIGLPPVQPGSSIMPGKVNPSMLEMLNQVCYQVLGQDAAVAHMTQAGQLELNVMMPALGSALFDAVDWLTNAVDAVTDKALGGLTVNRERCYRYAHSSLGLATLLNLRIGYSAAAEIAKESQQSGRSVCEIVTERGLMSAEDFDEMMLRAAQTGAIEP
jgi:aspartate ammonia-lyase